MIKTVTFPEAYDLMLEKETQRRFPHRTIIPCKHDREKYPYEMFDLFPKGLEIEFKSGVNIIAGENGSGKTTLISLIKSFVRYQDDHKGYIRVDGKATDANTIFFNGEEDNPLSAIPKMLNPESKDFLSLSHQFFNVQEESHGESMLPTLDYILDEFKGGFIIFMDEPETALSLKNQVRLAQKLKRSAKEYGNQLIVSTHSLAIIQKFITIFDMESRKWVNSEKYINEIL